MQEHPQPRPVSVNGIEYRWPGRPVVVVCVDGGDPAYFDDALARGVMPNVARFVERGFHALAAGTVPSFTNPNNLSIVTGVPPAVHGISGNYFLERESGEAIMMTGPELVRCATILGTFSQAGAKVAAITAKDKLRAQLGTGLGADAICFSAQHADRCTVEEHGIDDVLAWVGMPLPDMYSAELSLFVLQAGVRLLEAGRGDLLYLSLTDYIQHKHGPGEPESDRFHRHIDAALGRLADLGAVVAVTADHGMSDKADADGVPNVIWLQDILDARLGAGRTRVICPITDPFVAHHGALGGFVRVYCDADTVPAVMDIARALDGVERVHDRQGAADAFELPFDREGDVVVISDRATCIGAAKDEHDLSGLAGLRLRTHGGVAEAEVPIIVSEPVQPEALPDRGLRSHDVFRLALNGVRSVG